MVYLVAYDLPRDDARRPALRRSLRRCGDGWNYLESASLVSGDLSEEDILGALAPHLNATDRVLVIPVTRPFTGSLPRRAWRWLEERL